MKKLKLLILIAIVLIFATTSFACSGGVYGGDYEKVNSSSVVELTNKMTGKKSVIDSDGFSATMRTTNKATNKETNAVLENLSAIADGEYYVDKDGNVTAFASMREISPYNNYIGAYNEDGVSTIAQSEAPDGSDLTVTKNSEVYEFSTTKVLILAVFGQFAMSNVIDTILSAESVSAVYTDGQISKLELINAGYYNGTPISQMENASSKFYIVLDSEYNVTALKGETEIISEDQFVIEEPADPENENSEGTSVTVDAILEQKATFEIVKTKGKPIKPSWVKDVNLGDIIPETPDEYLGEFVSLDDAGISALATALTGKTTPNDIGRFTCNGVTVSEKTGESQEFFVHRFIDDNGELYDLQKMSLNSAESLFEVSIYYADGYIYTDYVGMDNAKIKRAIDKENYLSTAGTMPVTFLTCQGMADALVSGENIISVQAVYDGESFSKVEILADIKAVVASADGEIKINFVFGADGNIEMIRYEMRVIDPNDGPMIMVADYASTLVLPTAPSDLDEYVLTE